MPLGFKIPIIAIPLLTLALAVPASRFVILSAVGKTYQCPFWTNINTKRFMADRDRRIAEIRASAREIQSDDRYSLWRTRDGDFWVPKRNSEVLAFNLAEEEQDIYGKGVNAVHSGDVVLDGGANIGVFTRKALNAGASKVIAVEPAPENVESLRRNFASEIASGRVVIEPVGLWNTAAELPLRVDADNSARNSFVLEGPAISTVNIPLRTIDSIVADLRAATNEFRKTRHRRRREKCHRRRRPNHRPLSPPPGHRHRTLSLEGSHRHSRRRQCPGIRLRNHMRPLLI